MRFLLAGLIKIGNLSYEARHVLAVFVLGFSGGVRGPTLIALILVITVSQPFDGLKAATGLRHQKWATLIGFAPIGSLVALGISRFL